MLGEHIHQCKAMWCEPLRIVVLLNKPQICGRTDFSSISQNSTTHRTSSVYPIIINIWKDGPLGRRDDHVVLYQSRCFSLLTWIL